MDEFRAARLLGSPERRVAVRDLEIRAGSDNTYTVRGYACVTEFEYDVYGGPERGGWTENIKRGAFDTTLASRPDVCFLTNHEGMPLARTRSGTLVLRADSTGLESEATIDRRDPEGQALEIKMERGDLDQMSFGFRVTRQAWNEDYTERDVTEVNLDNGDVSIVNWPANPATSMSIVSARSALAVLGEMQVAELRSELGDITPEELRAAQARLGELVEALDPRSARSVEVEVTPVVKDMPAAEMDKLVRGLLAAALGTNEEERVEQLVVALRELSQPVRSSGITIGEPSKVVDEVTGLSIKDIVTEGNVEVDMSERSDEDVVEEPVEPAEHTPSRSVRSIARLRELIA